MRSKRMMTFLCFAMFSIVAVLAKDLKTVTLHAPQMVCQNCEKKVKDNIRFEKGVKEIVTNVENHTVTITYDADKTTVDNLIKGFKKINYDVTCDAQSAQECCTKAAGDKKEAGCCQKK